jgi:hypothetical protein
MRRAPSRLAAAIDPQPQTVSDMAAHGHENARGRMDAQRCCKARTNRACQIEEGRDDRTCHRGNALIKPPTIFAP